MNFEMNRQLVDDKMREMRKYASEANSVAKNRKGKGMNRFKQHRLVQAFRSIKVG